MAGDNPPAPPAEAAPAAPAPDPAPPHNNKHAETRLFEVNTGVAPHEVKGNRTRTSKYTPLTYLPKALYEQYRRIANIYFTIVAGVSLTNVSPVNPITTFIPLVIVIGVSLIKEAYEDFKRHKADTVENNRPTEVFDQDKGEFVERKWFEVKVGDIVRVSKDQPFPADLLLLSSYTHDGVSYIETMNLDGETNLKLRKALDQTLHMTDEHLKAFRATLECERPNASLYTFTGNLTMTDDKGEKRTIPLSPQAILLRGCSLRNTNRVIGIAIFAGHDTKVFMNARAPPSKRSTIERSLDRIIYCMFALLFIICIIGAAWNAVLTKTKLKRMWYLAPEEAITQFNPDKPATVGALSFITSFVLYGYLIPISLYVSIEIVKLAQVYFIMSDKAMYHEETDQYALARTSNLNEELGMIQAVLSDKTGTLTRNEMEFFKCSIAGTAYGRGITEIEKSVARRTGKKIDLKDDLPVPERYKAKGFNFFDDRLMDGKWHSSADRGTVYEFLRCLAVCHTVIPEGDPEEIVRTHQAKYEAESPDELALLMAAKQLGLMFAKRSTTTVSILEDLDGAETEVEYEILNVLEFNSTRKRMSVIFRDARGRIMMYCKGADTVIYDRLDRNRPDDELWESTRKHLEHFSNAGLRTLCLSYCELDPAEYDLWNEKFNVARTALDKREQKLMDCYELIEKNLILLGCTAIEDKLQVGVPETIAKLLEGGIRVWMLTGDKLETAVNIGFACSLLDNNMKQHMVSSETEEVLAAESAKQFEEAARLAEVAVRRQLDEAMAAIVQDEADALRGMQLKGRNNSKLGRAVTRIMSGKESEEGPGLTTPHALIIDGKSLAFALRSEDNKALMWQIGSRCASVICCRVSPRQKADVTALVKGQGLRTLGIGDGANDVGMIQEADIGVGISGLEGRQAVMASDFAISQFRFLEILLLVHGRWCYKRISRMVNFFFYKNIVFGLTLFYFNGCSFFSGALTYDEFYISLYNVMFTALTPLVMGIFDQDVPRKVSARYPGLYRQGPRNEYFSLRAKLGWFVNGFYQSAITFVGVIYANRLVSNRPNGMVVDNWHNGIVMYTVVVATVHIQLVTILDHWTWLHHLAIWGSQALWIIFLLAYGNLPSLTIFNYNIRYMFENMIADSIHYWLAILVVIILNLLPSFLISCTLRKLAPGDHVIVQEYLAVHDRSSLKEVEALETLESMAHPTDFYQNHSMTKQRPRGSSFVPDSIDHDPNNPVIRGIDQANQQDPHRHRHPAPHAPATQPPAQSRPPQQVGGANASGLAPGHTFQASPQIVHQGDFAGIGHVPQPGGQLHPYGRSGSGYQSPGSSAVNSPQSTRGGAFAPQAGQPAAGAAGAPYVAAVGDAYRPAAQNPFRQALLSGGEDKPGPSSSAYLPAVSSASRMTDLLGAQGQDSPRRPVPPRLITASSFGSNNSGGGSGNASPSGRARRPPPPAPSQGGSAVHPTTTGPFQKAPSSIPGTVGTPMWPGGPNWPAVPPPSSSGEVSAGRVTVDMSVSDVRLPGDPASPPTAAPAFLSPRSAKARHSQPVPLQGSLPAYVSHEDGNAVLPGGASFRAFTNPVAMVNAPGGGAGEHVPTGEAGLIAQGSIPGGHHPRASEPTPGGKGLPPYRPNISANAGSRGAQPRGQPSHAFGSSPWAPGAAGPQPPAQAFDRKQSVRRPDDPSQPF